MNSLCKGGCAAVALVAVAGSAHAQAKFEVKLGGDVYFEGGYVNSANDDGLRSIEMRNRFRLNIIPSAKSDNGLEYGARMRLRANAGDRSTDIDRGYMFAQGSFGQIRLGVSNGFDDEANYPIAGRPQNFLALGIINTVVNWMSPIRVDAASGRYSGSDVTGGVIAAVNGPGVLWSTLATDNNATKILYISPRFAGFQVGGSYTPRNDSSNTDVNRVKLVTSTASAQVSGNFHDLLEVGGNYSERLGDVKLGASAAYMWGKVSDSGVTADRFEDLGGFRGAATVEYAGLSVGGSYTGFGTSGQNKRYAYTGNTYNYHLGVQYVTGPLVVGGGYMYGTDPGNTTLPGKRALSVYEIGVGYTVAPGLTLQAQYDYFKADSDRVATVATGSPDDKGSVVLARTVMAF